MNWLLFATKSDADTAIGIINIAQGLPATSTLATGEPSSVIVATWAIPAQINDGRWAILAPGGSLPFSILSTCAVLPYSSSWFPIPAGM